MCLFAIVWRVGLGPSKMPVLWTLEVLVPADKTVMLEANHTPSYRDEIGCAWNFMFPSYGLGFNPSTQL
jgi:hypothetical protein